MRHVVLFLLVAMESACVYWRPVFHLLEAEHEIILVNAQHIKAVPGRKTDVKDAEWLADLLRHGLLRASFIPPAPVRDVRELTRYRQTLVYARTQEVTRLHKLLETANLKLGAVATDVLGTSGRGMLEAILATLSGEERPELLAELARGRLRAKLPQLRQALEGRVQSQRRVLLRHVLAHIDFITDFIEQQLHQLTGGDRGGAHAHDRGHRATRDHPLYRSHNGGRHHRGDRDGYASLPLRQAPGFLGGRVSREPPERRQATGGRTTNGNPWLRAALGEVTWAIAHTLNSYLAAQYHRFARRIGKQKAIVAVSHSLLVIIYHLLATQSAYSDLGPGYFDSLENGRLQRHYIRRLEQLGFAVTLTSPQTT